MKTILMQGDSITDAGRWRDQDTIMGCGYPTMVAGEMLLEYPGQFRVLNRGVGGDRVVDLYARIRRDFINLEPDYLSILIGVNDVWHNYSDSPNGVDNDKFRKIYCMLIEELLEARPGMKIFILEPFVLPGGGTSEHWEEFDREVRLRAGSAKYVAEKYGLSFIPLQEKYDELCKVCEPSYWLCDGVHPTAAGHKVIARALTAALKKEIG